VQTLNPARTIPDSPIYFHAEVPDKGRHDFRVPRASVIGRLLSPLMQSGIWQVVRSEGGAIDEVKAELIEEAIGAAIGICWRHATLEVETKRRDFDRGTDGLLEYGGEVLSELYEAGYTHADITPIINVVISKLMIAIPTPQPEVDERVGFTAAQTGSETSAT